MANWRIVIPYTKKWEGGLSRDTADTASKNPAPCTYNGKTGWHTNKGVTWGTFQANATKLGYKADCATFFAMPEDVWAKIMKVLFWDKVYGDEILSQAIAMYMFEYAWGYGEYGALNHMKQFFTAQGKTVKNYKDIATLVNLQSEVNEKKLYDALIAFKENKIKSSSQTKFIKGWLNRLEDFKAFTSGMVVDGAVKKNNKTELGYGVNPGLHTNVKIGIWVGVGLGVAIVVVLLYKNRNKIFK